MDDLWLILISFHIILRWFRWALPMHRIASFQHDKTIMEFSSFLRPIQLLAKNFTPIEIVVKSINVLS